MRRHLPLTGIVLLAALLRIPTLGSASLWVDEGHTYAAVRGSLGEMFRRIVDDEATPPLSFVVEWLAVRVTGTSEFALRLPSALLGLAAVPAMYVLVRDHAGRRAGLFAAALTATNPMLIWHAQDARAYALLVILLIGTLLALQRDRVWIWSALAVLALATHYVAALLLVPEAFVLLARHRRRVIVPILVPAAVLLGLLVFAASQPDTSSWIELTSLPKRLVQVPVRFLAGYELAPDAAVAVTLVLIPLAVMAIRSGWAAPSARPIALMGAASIALPILGALLARDIFIPRAVIGALVAFIAVAAIGLERRRRGTAVLIAASIGWTVITIATAGGEKLRGENWRSAAAAADGAGVLLVLPHAGFTPIEYYRRDVHSVPRITTRSLAVVTMSHGYTEDCSYDNRPQGVRPTAIVRGPCWRVLRYRFHEPRQISAGGASLLTR